MSTPKPTTVKTISITKTSTIKMVEEHQKEGEKPDECIRRRLERLATIEECVAVAYALGGSMTLDRALTSAELDNIRPTPKQD